MIIILFIAVCTTYKLYATFLETNKTIIMIFSFYWVQILNPSFD